MIIIIKCKTNQLMIVVGSLLISGALYLFFLVDWCGQEERFGNVSRYELPWLMLVFLQKFILGMLTNFGSMALDRIHNTLKVKGFNWTLSPVFPAFHRNKATSLLFLVIATTYNNTVLPDVLCGRTCLWQVPPSTSKLPVWSHFRREVGTKRWYVLSEEVAQEVRRIHGPKAL